MKLMHSVRHYFGSTSEGVRIYDLFCMFCGKSDRRGIPKLSSVGLYFTNPIECPHCKKWSVYYASTPKQEK